MMTSAMTSDRGRDLQRVNRALAELLRMEPAPVVCGAEAAERARGGRENDVVQSGVERSSDLLDLVDGQTRPVDSTMWTDGAIERYGRRP